MRQPARFDVVSLQEAVDRRGQRIESFAIDTWDGAAWVAARPIASDELTTVGHRRLVRLQSPITTDRVRVRVTGARLAPTLAEVGLYLQSTELLPPAIADRDADGRVAISHPDGGTIVYTTDGSAPAAGCRCTSRRWRWRPAARCEPPGCCRTGASAWPGGATSSACRRAAGRWWRSTMRTPATRLPLPSTAIRPPGGTPAGATT
ncbi:hypothetical protein HUX88_24720 [Duganella sp. BJB1802]|uniref:hypothetical protein n=1 Tax=Duganella sp. BJB1802 TaxID=2744575 RepID=UPI001593A7DB|nr:hypothetical protein [Duganella sp. BJB1802]